MNPLRINNRAVLALAIAFDTQKSVGGKARGIRMAEVLQPLQIDRHQVIENLPGYQKYAGKTPDYFLTNR